MIDHRLKEIEWDEDGKMIAVCNCDWRSLPTNDPERSVYDHERRMLGW